MCEKTYDSCGIAALDEKDGSLRIIKHTNEARFGGDALPRLINSIRSSEFKTRLAICHTRWATHGAKNEVNAHPHQDSK